MGGHTITGVSTSIAAFVGYTARGRRNSPVKVASFAAFERAFGKLSAGSPLSYCVKHFFQNGGKEARVVRVAGRNGAAPAAADLSGSLSARSGIYALEKLDIFNLLVMPDAAAGDGMPSVLAEAIAYSARRRAFMIIDLPENVGDVAKAQAWMSGPAAPLRSRDCAFYFPRLREPVPLMKSGVRSFPASGAVAGVYARTDAQQGVWKAPAGSAATIVGAAALSYAVTQGENGTLASLGVNCLRTLPAALGPVVWGARTGSGADTMADEYKYVPVRRLALFLEESIRRGIRWAEFEPNAEALWAAIRRDAEGFLLTQFQKGAFQGRTPREAFFVKCDRETMTSDDLDHGRLNIVVGFAPLKPSEFVIITIQQIAGRKPDPGGGH